MTAKKQLGAHRTENLKWYVSGNVRNVVQ